MMTDSKMDMPNVPIITASEIHECCEKNIPTEGNAPSNIFAPIKKRIKLTPCFKNRKILMMPFKAKNREINPITAKTLEEMARKFSSEGERILRLPSLITPIMAGIESTANKISVEPMTSSARKMLVICLLPLILVKKWGE